MIKKWKLLTILLFSIVLLSSISLISAADSNAMDMQMVNGEETELDYSNSDMQSIDEEIGLESDSNEDKLSDDGLDSQLQDDENKINTEIIADNITTFPDEGRIIAKLIDESGKPLVGYNVTLDLKHVHRNFVTNGTGEVYFDLDGTNLPEGNYTGVLKFKGNESYAESTLNIKVQICVLTSIISADDITFIYKESGILSVYLKDSNGNPIDNATVMLSLSPIYESLVTNSSGQVEFNLSSKLSVGTFDGYVYFDKTNRYIGSIIPVMVTVNKVPMQLNASDLTYDYGDESYLVVTLNDKYGVPTANEIISVKIGGNILTEKTDENGTAKFLMNLAPGSYNALVSFAGNKTHMSNSSNVIITVNGIKEKISINNYNFNSVYNQGKYITVTLKDVSGKGVANKNFVVDFNGKVKKYKTDSKGQIKLPISSLVPKTYKATLTFLGDSKYEPTSLNITLVVKKAKPYLFASKKKFNAKTSVKKYKVTLKNNKNVAMKNVKVYLKVKGKTYVAKTNSKGQAIFKLKKLTKKGTYKATVTYKGDKCYNKVVKKSNIKVR